MATTKLLGELLIQKNLVNQDVINDALRVQVGGNRRLGSILVRMGKLGEDQLVDVLSEQLNIEKIDISATFDPKVKKKLPRYLCRKYDAIPLKLKVNNILELAMSDPSDYQAINDLEQYTGHVIEARLARQSDIAAATAKHVPYSLSDFFSPQATTRFTRVAVVVCLALIVAIGGFTYRYVQNATYGTVSIAKDSTIYKNHDLMLGFDNNGTINFLGRGAFAKGYYAASFTDPDVLNSFITSKKTDFSEKQKEWLAWVIENAKTQGTSRAVALNQ